MDPRTPAPESTVEYCYRHPNERTGVHCTRCGRPICTQCMIPAPVGYQCPECVAEARRAFRQGPARRARTAAGLSMTAAMLGLLVVVFVAEVATGSSIGGLGGRVGGSVVEWGVMFPPFVAQGEYYRLFTAMFLHASLIHIAFNGWALWIFGTFVEREFGRVRWLVIYLLGGLMGSAASYAFGPVAQASLGASGAVVALFGAFIAFNLKRRDTALSRAYLQQAAIIVLLNVFLSFGLGGVVDWRAHLGGLVGGLMLGGIFDAIGPFRNQAARVAGVLGVATIVVALVAWRTADLRSLFLL